MVDLKNQSWVKNAVIYQILIDRFSGYSKEKNWKKPIFCGGTLKGIIKRLPYLQSLGVNAIWISPFYKTNAYHGYHITDFFEVDPHFGTKKDLHCLVTKAHEFNMKLIADFVPNHCSYKHPFFIDAQSDYKSKYRKWFYFLRWPDKYLSFLSFNEIPKINLDHKEARRYIVESAKYWLSFGLDGLRLDHVIGPSHRFWNYFVSTVKKSYPESVLLGEAWMQGIRFHELRTIKMKGKYRRWILGSSSDALLRSYQGILDGVLDFQGQQLLQSYGINKRYPIKKLITILNNHYKNFDKQYVLPLFLDNHDMDRILFTCNNNINLMKKLVKTQFIINQPVIIYYGTEIGMSQSQSIWDISNHGDIIARQPMQWNHINKDLFLFYQDICHKKNVNKIT